MKDKLSERKGVPLGHPKEGVGRDRPQVRAESVSEAGTGWASYGSVFKGLILFMTLRAGTWSVSIEGTRFGGEVANSRAHLIDA